MTDIWIDTDEVRSASNRFSAEAVPEASTARESVSTLCTGQAPAAKWGEQSGPLTFQAAYQDYLRNTEQSLTVLQQELEGFARALTKTADSYEETDQGTADAVQTLRTNYEEANAHNRSDLSLPYVESGATWNHGRGGAPVPPDPEFSNKADPEMGLPGDIPAPESP